MMITFPKLIKFTPAQLTESIDWAESFNANSKEGAVYGRLCELALVSELQNMGHVVTVNDGKNKNDLYWDLNVDGTLIDVKSTIANSFTFSQSVVEHLYDAQEKTFVCYSYNKENKSFSLVGVLTTDDVKRNIVTSKFGGYYIMKYVVKANGRQSLS
jgi:hypothetical protein